VNERKAVLDALNLKPGMSVLDLQAGSGFVADGLKSLEVPDLRIICVEESPELAREVSSGAVVLNESLIDTGIPSKSIDAAICLAGFHHEPQSRSIFEEVSRCLKPGGDFSCAEVERASPMDTWLNQFVDQFSPNGHRGFFFEQGRFTRELSAAGFIDVRENVRLVPWVFESETEMLDFLSDFFGVYKASRSILKEAAYSILPVRSAGGQIYIDWKLIYAFGKKRSN